MHVILCWTYAHASYAYTVRSCVQCAYANGRKYTRAFDSNISNANHFHMNAICNTHNFFLFLFAVNAEYKWYGGTWYCMRMPPTVITAFWRKLCSSVRVDWLDRERNIHHRPLQRSLSHILLTRIDKVVDYCISVLSAPWAVSTDKIFGRAVV